MRLHGCRVGLPEHQRGAHLDAEAQHDAVDERGEEAGGARQHVALPHLHHRERDGEAGQQPDDGGEAIGEEAVARPRHLQQAGHEADEGGGHKRQGLRGRGTTRENA